MLFSDYIKEDYKPKKTIESAIVKVTFKVFFVHLLFVSYSCITLMLELD